MFFIFSKNIIKFDAWLYAYILSLGVAFIITKGYVISISRGKEIKIYKKDLIDLFHYGKWAQLANIAQLFNYRLGYYLLEYFAGKTALGIYSSAVAIAEGVWLISKSFAMVVFTRISNMQSREDALALAFQYARISLYFSLLFIVFLLLIPSTLYVSVFGPEFGEIKGLLILLSPGVAVFSLSTVYAHYFSGTARPRISSYSSLVGLIVTVLFGILLIPVYEKNGVAITASLSFISSSFYLVYMILKEPGASVSSMLPQKTDVYKMIDFLRMK